MTSRWKPTRVPFLAFALAAAVAFAPGAAHGQDVSISGIVTDTTGGVLPGVTVEALNQATGEVTTAFTDGYRLVRVLRAPFRVVRRDVRPARVQHRRPRRRGGRARLPRHPRRRDGRAAPGNGRGRRDAGGTAVGHRLPGAGRRHPRRGLHEPGRRGPHQPVADGRPVVQRQHSADQRRRHHRAARQPADHRARPHAHPRQRQAPSSRRRHHPGSATASPTGRRGRTCRPFRPSPCGRSKSCGTARRPSTAPTPSPAS